MTKIHTAIANQIAHCGKPQAALKKHGAQRGCGAKHAAGAFNKSRVCGGHKALKDLHARDVHALQRCRIDQSPKLPRCTASTAPKAAERGYAGFESFHNGRLDLNCARFSSGCGVGGFGYGGFGHGGFGHGGFGGAGNGFGGAGFGGNAAYGATQPIFGGQSALSGLLQQVLSLLDALQTLDGGKDYGAVFGGADKIFGGDGKGGGGCPAGQQGAHQGATIFGTNSGEKLVGTPQGDLIKAFGGDDRVEAGKGDDCVHGGRGDDMIFGGAGDDVLRGGCGDDKIEASKGDDRLFGGRGADDLWGGKGDDVIAGGRGSDQINGGDGLDTVLFHGKRADWALTHEKGVIRAENLKTGEVDTLKNVERATFRGDCETVDLENAKEISGKGRIWGDPHFIGAEGGKYDVQGAAGKTYNILSDQGIQVNAEFRAWGSKGATVIGAMGVSLGQDQIRIGEQGALAINGVEIAEDGVYLDGAVTKKGTDISVKQGEYQLDVQAKSHINVDLHGTDVTSDWVAPHGLWGQTLDGDGVARNGDKGHGAQGGGAIETVTGEFAAKGDKTTVTAYEVSGLFDTSFANFNQFAG